VDDFFRPFHSPTAFVKGRYSIECYNKALEEAFIDYSHRKGINPEDVFEQIHLWAFHIPYASMPLFSLDYLLEKFTQKTAQERQEYIKNHKVHSSNILSKKAGNIYTGSLYLGLASLLKEEALQQREKLINQKILLISYGSGNTMCIFEATVCDKALEVIDLWDFNALKNPKEITDFNDYENWIKNGSMPTENALGFYLKNMRENDHYKEYGYQKK